jgi:hypothetical protein
MGGFVSRTGHHPVATSEQLVDVAEYLTDIRAVEVEDIEDKSKGEAISKGVALVQGLWFTAQCLARVHQDLPVTELEIATLAFAVVNIFIWLLWWNKPLDVQRPILVGPKEALEISTSGSVNNQETLLVAPDRVAFAADAKPWQAGFWNGIIPGVYNEYEPEPYTSVPLLWSTNNGDQDKDIYSFLIECFVGTVFGAIHCAAWNTVFPSTDEMWMWRSCSVLVAALPVIFGLTTLVGKVVVNAVDEDSIAVQIISVIFIFVPIPVYIIARLFLIILPLISFRALPPGALTDVNWGVYIPHL